MKISAFILSIIVLVLSCLPCTDRLNDAVSAEKLQLVETSTQQSHNEEGDCSPFCHCACCNGFSVNHTLATVSTIEAFLENPKTAFLPSQVIEIALPIWQPPQLV